MLMELKLQVYYMMRSNYPSHFSSFSWPLSSINDENFVEADDD